jgi:flagellar P-ring protein precursor FlgI
LAEPVLKEDLVRRPWLLFIVALALALSARDAQAERLRDLVNVYGARDNQLIGYGLVTGLAGTGDDVSVPFTAQSILALLRRLGVQADPTQLRLRNVAAVMVTATVPAFAKPGTKIDVTVGSIGNARSLSGGILVQTVLKGPDQKSYAVAQGSILLGGFEAHGSTGSSAKTGAVNAGRVPEGAIIEREIATSLVVNNDHIRFELRNPGFGVAARIAAAIDAKLGAGTAHAADGGAIDVRASATQQEHLVEYVAQIEDLEVVPVRRARVVINERTGTIVAGGDVRLNPAAIVHGNLTIVVREAPTPSQPTAPFGKGTTVVVPRSEIETSEERKQVAYLAGEPSLADVASALGSLGLSPRELASVLESLRSAGALEAEVEVQ